jgi:hypothetical protein
MVSVDTISKLKIGGNTYTVTSPVTENKKTKAKTSKELLNDVLELIRKHTRNMSDDEAYKFHELFKILD